MLNSSSFALLSSSWSSVSDSRRISFSCIRFLTAHEFGPDRQLVRGKPHGFLRQYLVDSRDLEQHATGPHDGNPVVGRTLARAHPDFGRLPRDRLVREDADPHLPATLEVVHDRAPSRLDLARGEVRRLLGLQAE